MKRTDCKQCLLLGRTAPKVRCATCRYCKEHPGCHCVMCSICRKRVGPTTVCPKCVKCKDHHVELIRGDFPFRKCEYLGAAKPSCACPEYSDYKPCKVCKLCPRHRCDCPPTFAINPLSRTLGCELEIAEYNGFTDAVLNVIPIAYHFDHDGSVRPSQRELVTARMLGDKVPKGMAALADQLEHFGATVNDSCGFHVHVDAVHEGPQDLRRILAGFRLFQSQIFGTLVHEDRQHNVYCPPLAIDDVDLFDLMALDSNAAINNWFHQYLYNMAPAIGADYTLEERRMAMKAFEARLKERKGHKYENNARRSAINFHSWMMRGTVEFRLKEGTIAKDDLINWPLWCGWFVQKISSISDKELMWWMKKTPSLIELSERFAASSLGGARMPKSVLEWVVSKVEASKHPRLKKKLVPSPVQDEGRRAVPPSATGRAWRITEDPVPRRRDPSERFTRTSYIGAQLEDLGVPLQQEILQPDGLRPIATPPHNVSLQGTTINWADPLDWMFQPRTAAGLGSTQPTNPEPDFEEPYDEPDDAF